jgi:hypothetical protein
MLEMSRVEQENTCARMRLGMPRRGLLPELNTQHLLRHEEGEYSIPPPHTLPFERQVERPHLLLDMLFIPRENAPRHLVE